MTTLQVAIVQAAPVPLAIGDGIDKAVRRGAIHKNNGARKKSRAARIAAGNAS